MVVYDPTEEFCGCGHDAEELLGQSFRDFVVEIVGDRR